SAKRKIGLCVGTDRGYEPILERKIAIDEHLHFVHIELDVPDLHVVGNSCSHSHRLPFFSLRGIQGKGGRETDGWGQAICVVRKIIDDLQAGGVSGDIGETVVNGNGTGRPGQIKGSDEIPSVSGKANIENAE